MADGEAGVLRAGRNLVVCADGTGNAAGRGGGTNVFRLYDAIDHRVVDERGLELPAQLAVHDDGVGTSSNALLRAIGGVFGFGLAANVRQLYAWLSRNYRSSTSEHDADQIYLFGFSRGAFTVRCLAGVIAHAGLRRTDSEEEAEEAAARAWLSYKGRFQRFAKPTPLPSSYEEVKIRFLGVWDTVDAYGFPVDEVKDGLAKGTQLLFQGPLARFAWTRFSNNRPSPLIENVRHAIALDDERHTFHPVVFDESSSGQDDRVTDIKQRWFAGAHADVGGGYPRDSLAHVSLLWMMEEASRAGIRVDDQKEERRPCVPLRFSEGKKRHYEECANALGPHHDSRSGVGVFYRYRPRDAFELHNNHVARGRDADSPRIPEVHSSVLERVEKMKGVYLPQALSRFRLVHSDEATTELELPESRYAKVREAHRARRVLYAAFLFWFVLFALFPWGRELLFGARDASWVEPAYGNWGLGHLMTYVARISPSFFGDWLTAFRKEPFYLVFLLTGFAFMQLFRRDLVRRTVSDTQEAWRGRRELDEQDAQDWTDESPMEGTLSLFRRLAVPWLVAALVVVGGVYAVLGGVWRMPFPAQSTQSPSLLLPLVHERVVFSTSAAAVSTEGSVQKGKTYRVSLQVEEPWFDREIPAGPGGLSATPALLQAAMLFKRDDAEPWFSLLQAVGSPLGGTERVLLGEPWVAPRTGRLLFFVNDATCYLCPGGPWFFYENNRGTAVLQVEQVQEAEAEARRPTPGTVSAEVNALKGEPAQKGIEPVK